MQTTTNTPAFADLLARAVSEPGQIHTAYSAFHGYSVGNQLLALFECSARGIEPGPLATFPAWKARGRHVMKGQKAITLCMPITCKRRPTDDEQADDAPATFTRFVFRPNWFTLAQTDGQPFTAPELPEWSKARALETLNVTEEPFAMMDGNCQGYAKARTIAISPLAALPLKTTFHELAHVLLGHTTEAEQTDHERTPRSLREVEAEAVAMLCCSALQLPGIEYSRGYIQHWNASGEAIPERSAAKIFKVADQILRAGRPADASPGTGVADAMTALIASRRTGHLRTVPVADVDHLTADWFIVCRDTDIPAPPQRKRRRPRREPATTESAASDRELQERTRKLIAEATALEARIREDLRKRGLL